MSGKTVLVVEDNPLTRGFLREMLLTGGFEVLEAETGGEALRLIAERRPRIVLQDMALPDMDGIELLERTRRTPGGDVPVIALSGLPAELQRAQSQLDVQGFTDFLEKPISGRALLLAIESHLSRAGEPESPAVPAAVRDGRPARVLVVDRADSLPVLGMRLEQEGYGVVLCEDGEDALAEIRARPPAAVVCAANLPGLDGFRLCRAVRGDPALATVPVVVFSGVFSESSDHALARLAGASSLRTRLLEDIAAGLAEALAESSPPRAARDDAEFENAHARCTARALLAARIRVADLEARVRFQDAALSLLGVISESLHQSGAHGREPGDLLARCLTAAGSSLGAAFLKRSDGSLFPAARLGFRDDGGGGLESFWGCPQLLERVAENGVPLVVTRDTVGQAVATAVLEGSGAQSMLLAPLASRGEVLGVLMMASHRFDLADWVDLSRAVTLQIGQALHIGRVLDRLAASEASNYDMFAASVLGIYRTDASGRFRAVNAALASMLGWPSTEELEAVEIGSLYRHPEERARLVSKYRDADRFEGLEVEWVRRDGSPLTVRLTGRALRDTDGAHRGFEVFVEDISGRREMEQEVRQAQRLDAVRRLAGGVAHEYRNLLTAIAGHAELMDSSMAAEDPNRNHVAAIRRAAETAEQVTRDLLTFARRQEASPRVVDLDAVVEDALPTLRRVLGEDVEVRRRRGGRSNLVIADPGVLEQVLVHLAVHARDMMPEGGAFLLETGEVVNDAPHAGPDGSFAGGPCAVLEAANTGPPLGDEERSHLLEPEFRGEGSRASRIGLASVYGMVHQAGGAVRVREGREGEGCRIRVLLPLAQVAPLAPGTPPPPPREPAEPARPVILVAEDEEAVRSLVSETLRREGYEVLEASHGEEALHRASQTPGRIHLLVTDVVMPRMGGRRLADALRAARPDLPVLFVSGYTEYGATGGGGEGGGEFSEGEFLQKPFTPRLLAARVKAMLEDSGAV